MLCSCELFSLRVELPCAPKTGAPGVETWITSADNRQGASRRGFLLSGICRTRFISLWARLAGAHLAQRFPMSVNFHPAGRALPAVESGRTQSTNLIHRSQDHGKSH